MAPLTRFATLICERSTSVYISTVASWLTRRLLPDRNRRIETGFRLCAARAPFIVLTSPESNEFWPAFQERWASLLCERTDDLQNWIDEMVRALSQGQLKVADGATARAALDDLHARFKRLESVSGGVDAEIEARSVGHFVSYGAAILGAPAPTNGEAVRPRTLRYGEVRAALEQLKTWLSAMELSPAVVLGLSDYNSQIIGRALALRLKMRYESADINRLSQSEAIIVAADSRSIGASTLTRIYPEQVLFAFNVHPLGASLVPDVAALSRLELVFPWQLEAEEAAAEAGADEEVTLREASSVAAQVAATRAINDPAWPARLEFYRRRGSLLAAGNPRLTRLPMLPVF